MQHFLVDDVPSRIAKYLRQAENRYRKHTEPEECGGEVLKQFSQECKEMSGSGKKCSRAFLGALWGRFVRVCPEYSWLSCSDCRPVEKSQIIRILTNQFCPLSESAPVGQSPSIGALVANYNRKVLISNLMGPDNVRLLLENNPA